MNITKHKLIANCFRIQIDVRKSQPWTWELRAAEEDAERESIRRLHSRMTSRSQIDFVYERSALKRRKKLLKADDS